jgi:hypothetical protein
MRDGTPFTLENGDVVELWVDARQNEQAYSVEHAMLPTLAALHTTRHLSGECPERGRQMFMFWRENRDA